jgi:hypothetical protein
LSFSFSEAKAEARRAVHDTFAVPAMYSDAVVTTPVEVHVRFHSRRATEVLLPGEGLAEVLEATPRVLFDKAEMANLGLTAMRNGQLVFAVYDNLTVVLDVEEKYDGPIYTAWTAIQK